MHNSIIGTSGMDQDNHVAHDNGFRGNDSWVGMSSYDQSPMTSYGGFGYMDGLPSDTMGRMPSESISRMPSLPAPIQPRPEQSPQLAGSQQQQQHQSHHGQLPMLPMLSMPPSMPSTTWPSQLTNPGQMSNPGSYSAPPSMPTTAQRPKPARLSTPGHPTPRRTLTDDDRRRMCQYAEDNPTAKQLDIGRMFGVERSTVSKVLRHKDKYLRNEERSSSPVKRPKGKLPDIERAVASWARKAQQSGREVTDSELWEKARHFSHGVSGGEDLMQKLGPTWLEKFKQRHNIGPGRLMRRASETNIPDSAKMSMASPTLAPSQPSSAISPSSPAGGRSPLSGARSDDEGKDGMNEFYNFQPPSYKQGPNQSTTSLNSAFTDTGNSSFSGSAVSPTAPFTFSPDSNVGGFLPPDPRHVPGGEASNFQRPRSQTFPTLDLEYMNATTAAGEPDTPKYTVSSTAPSSALESPDHELNAPHFSLDSAIAASPRLHTSTSNTNLAASSQTVGGGGGGSAGTGAGTGTGAGSRSNSPTLEDARRGLDLALSYVQKSGSRYEENDLMLVIRFFEKVGLRQYAQHFKTPSSSIHPMSGLSRIPEGGEVEMGNAPPTTSVKIETMTA